MALNPNLRTEVSAVGVFETWPRETKINFLLYFLRQHGLNPNQFLVHGSFSLEIMGFDLVTSGHGANDIDLVCLDDAAFVQLAEVYTEFSTEQAIIITWGDVKFEIFRQWAPAPELAEHTHVIQERACSVVVPTQQGETCILVANIYDVIIYKQARPDAPPLKRQRDQAHLEIMTLHQRELLIALMHAASGNVGDITREMAIQVALGEEGNKES